MPSYCRHAKPHQNQQGSCCRKRCHRRNHSDYRRRIQGPFWRTGKCEGSASTTSPESWHHTSYPTTPQDPLPSSPESERRATTSWRNGCDRKGDSTKLLGIATSCSAETEKPKCCAQIVVLPIYLVWFCVRGGVLCVTPLLSGRVLYCTPYPLGLLPPCGCTPQGYGC